MTPIEECVGAVAEGLGAQWEGQREGFEAALCNGS